ncbi:MAG: tetratricopeptide repeat protein [bacterium]|nr:tetratricopeptide repeat protein [bacterium]
MKLPRLLTPILRRRNQLILFIVILGVGIALYTLSLRNSATENTMRSSRTDTLITDAQFKLTNDSDNPSRYVSLCELYIQKIRETADTAYYSKCDELLDKANSLDPNNAQVLSAQASVAYGKHSFLEGLELSKKAQQINPSQISYYGLIADGQLELGQYEAAVASVQTMVSKKPDLSSFNRVAYIREIYGDIEGAKTALQSAISAGSSFSENIAFSQVELAKLFARDDLAKAESIYRQALQTYPNHSPSLEGLGKLAFARKNYQEAEKYFKQAAEYLPLAQYSTALADTYDAMGDQGKADQQYYLAELAFNSSTNGGVNNDYELSVFYSQQNKENQKSLELAKKALTSRPNMFSYDALAWSFYRAGNYQEAQAHSNKALVQGKNVPVVIYHAGMIAEKLNQKEQAKSLLRKAMKLDEYFLESHFSLLDREEAHNALERLH